MCYTFVSSIFSFFGAPDKSTNIIEDQYVTVTGQLMGDPYYHTARETKKIGEILKVELNTYPGISFENEGYDLLGTDWQAIRAEVKYPDTVALKVLKSEYEKNRLQNDSMALYHEVYKYPVDKFRFYSFKCRNKEYVTNNYGTTINLPKGKSLPIVLSIFVCAGIAWGAFRYLNSWEDHTGSFRATLNGNAALVRNAGLLIGLTVLFFVRILPDKYYPAFRYPIFFALAAYLCWKIYRFRNFTFDDKNLYVKSYIPLRTDVVALENIVSYANTMAHSGGVFKYRLEWRSGDFTESRSFYPYDDSSDKLGTYLPGRYSSGAMT